jgi:hypothetical protein
LALPGVNFCLFKKDCHIVHWHFGFGLCPWPAYKSRAFPSTHHTQQANSKQPANFNIFNKQQPLLQQQTTMAQVPPGDITTMPAAKIIFNAPFDDKHTYYMKVRTKLSSLKS